MALLQNHRILSDVSRKKKACGNILTEVERKQIQSQSESTSDQNLNTKVDGKNNVDVFWRLLLKEF